MGGLCYHTITWFEVGNYVYMNFNRVKFNHWWDISSKKLYWDHCSTTPFPGLRGKQFPQWHNNRNAYAWWNRGMSLRIITHVVTYLRSIMHISLSADPWKMGYRYQKEALIAISLMKCIPPPGFWISLAVHLSCPPSKSGHYRVMLI